MHVNTVGKNTIGKAAEHNKRARRHWLLLVKNMNVKT